MATRLAAGAFFGQMPASVKVAGMTFAESVYTAEIDIPSHEHVNAFLCFAVERRYEETYGGKAGTGGPSALVFHPAGEPHSNCWHSAGGRVFHIDISRVRAEAIRERFPILDSPAEFHGGVAPWLAGRLCREYRRPDGASPLALEGLSLEILAKMSRCRVLDSERTPPRWLLRTRELLHDRFTENPADRRRDRRPPRTPRPRVPPAVRLHPE